MTAELAEGVRWRHEPFGSVAYVPGRDSFFALNPSCTQTLDDMLAGSPPDEPTNRYIGRLAELGIIKDGPRRTPAICAAPGLVGYFPALPVASRPLLVNCFSTAHCPLACTYCYADDMMIPYRKESEERLPDRVFSTAESVDALVAVVTGGEPLSRPQQTAALLRKLATTKAVVLDTSGVGDFSALLPALRETRAHLRVSLDSSSGLTNDAQRPIRRSYQAGGTSSWQHAINTIKSAIAEELPVSVQSVLTAANSNIDELLRLHQLLLSMGVRKWNIHIVVSAGKAGRHSSVRSARQPDRVFLTRLASFAAGAVDRRHPMDVRVTNNNDAPNSVLLIDSRGDLMTEALGRNGKIILASYGDDQEKIMLALDEGINFQSHYSRYLNCDVFASAV